MKKATKTFFAGKGMYVALLAAALFIVAITVIISLSLSSPTDTLETSVNEQANITSREEIKPSSTEKPTSLPPKTDDSSQTPSEDKPSENEEPVSTKINFIMPVENGVCIKEYTEASVVYNKTLGVYTGHMGMDITGEEGARVLAVLDGKVSSIESSYLDGVTVIVTHANGLKTVYNSREVDENLSVGDSVRQGDVLGVISSNNRREYKDGAHLHFEVEENGVKVSPTKYFSGYEK